MRQHGLSVGFQPAEATSRRAKRGSHRDELEVNTDCSLLEAVRSEAYASLGPVSRRIRYNSATN